MNPYDQTAALYRTWWSIAENSLRMFAPGAAAAGAEPRVAHDLPGAVQPLQDAMELMRRFLMQVSGAALAWQGQPGIDWLEWTRQSGEKLASFWESGKAALAAGGAAGAFAMPMLRWPATAGGADTAQPFWLGLDRAFGGVADAFGWGPSRMLLDAWRALAAAERERRAAQLDYLAVLSGAAGKAIGSVSKQLGEMAARGERVASFLAWTRLCASALDESVHEAMQSASGLNVSTGYMRAMLRWRQQLHRLVELLSGQLNVPTRAELDDAHLEIQQLKREMRRLRQQQSAGARKSRPREGRRGQRQ